MEMVVTKSAIVFTVVYVVLTACAEAEEEEGSSRQVGSKYNIYIYGQLKILSDIELCVTHSYMPARFGPVCL